jgi:hypothetical protein
MAQIIITVPDDQVDRIRTAFSNTGVFFNDPPNPPATIQQVKDVLATHIKNIVRDYEREVARRAAIGGIVDVEPS